MDECLADHHNAAHVLYRVGLVGPRRQWLGRGSDTKSALRLEAMSDLVDIRDCVVARRSLDSKPSKLYI